MCQNNDEKATKALRARLKKHGKVTFYKTYQRRSPASGMLSLYQRVTVNGPGIVTSTRHDKQLNSSEQRDGETWCGIHTWRTRVAAARCAAVYNGAYADADALVVPVTCRAEDFVVAGRHNAPNGAGAATAVFMQVEITKRSWNKAMKGV